MGNTQTDHAREVTFVVRKLLNLMRRLSEVDMPLRRQLTPMQGRTIGYICCHAGTDVFQRDLEQEFQIRRSTASAMLQTMERNGLIRREPVPYDARLKKLVLTPEAVAFNERFKREMARAQAVIIEGVTEEELDAFFRVTAKFEQNLNRDLAARQAVDRERLGEEKA